MATVIRTLDFLPEIFQTPTNQQFLSATLDQLVNPPNLQKIQGYVGNRFGYGVNANDHYVTEPDATRTNYQLDPGIVFTASADSINPPAGTATDFISYPGMLNAITTAGGLANNNSRLFNSQFYSWDSFTNLDPLINFNQYYWAPQGLPAVTVAAAIVYDAANYVVTPESDGYQISVAGTGVGSINPTLTFIRGGTYTFYVNQSTQFWIQGEPGVLVANPSNPSQNVRQIYGVENNGAETGTVTFTVPAADAQSQYSSLQGNNLVSVVSNVPYQDINGQLVSSLRGIDGVTSLNGLTLMFYNTGIPNEEGFTGSFFDNGQNGQAYDANDNTLTTPQSINITATATSGNLITCSSTADLVVNQAVTFTGTAFGTLIPSTTNNDVLYFVSSITSPTQFTVALQLNGSEVVMQDAAGSMTCNINQGLYQQGYISQVNFNFYKITYIGDPSNPIISLSVASAIPVNQIISAVYGNTYGGARFFLDQYGNIEEIPYISAPLNTLYYQDGSNPNAVGVINLIEANISNQLDVDTQILGKTNFTSTNGVAFTNGLKVQFNGDVVPTSYLSGQYYVQGVGIAIQLLPVTDFLVPEPFTGSIYNLWDSAHWDIDNFDDTLYIPTVPDYITIAREALNRNPWSRSNRWFHIDVIKATAQYNNNPAIVTAYATQENKAARPIIEFYPNLELFNYGTVGVGAIDFIDFRTTDCLNLVAGQPVYYPDVDVYTNYNATINNPFTTTATFTTPTNMNGSTSYAQMTSVAVNSDGLFLAVGYDGSNYPVYATSIDGSIWTTPALMNGSTSVAQMISVTVNSAGLFVAVGYDGSNSPVYATSSDGSTWTTPALMNGSTSYAQMTSVTVNSAGLFVAVGYDNNFYPLYATSSDGSIWTTPVYMNGSVTSAIMTGVTVNADGLFVAVGYDNNNRYYPSYATSSDGSTWTTPALMNGSTSYAQMTSVTVNSAGLFVAVGHDSSYISLYATSTDGRIWTTPAPMNGSSGGATSVTVNSDGLFVAVGVFPVYGYPVYTTSVDGSTWTALTTMGSSATPQAPFGVAVNSDGLFVAVGIDASNSPIYADATITRIATTTTTVTVPANAVTGTFVVGMYINDSLNILPPNTQITKIEGTTTLTLTVAWLNPAIIVGQSKISIVADPKSNTNYALFSGARVLFAADPNENTKIYVVSFSTISEGSTPVITLSEAPNGQLIEDNVVAVIRGYNYQGYSFWYNGVVWVKAQQKITDNQAPLFDVFDSSGISFGDRAYYVGTSFKGSKLFDYAVGTGTDDPVLGFPLSYSSVNNIGDISFDVTFNSDTFTYVNSAAPVTKNINTGFVYNSTGLQAHTRLLGWQTAVGPSVQYQIFEFNYVRNYVTPNNTFQLDVAPIATGVEPWPTLEVYVNNILQPSTNYTVTTTSTTTTVVINIPNSITHTLVQVLILSDQVSNTAFYTIPINLSNNPFNTDITTTNVGDIRRQYASIFNNCPNTTGQLLGPNNYRDLGNLVPYGNAIIQNSAALVLPAIFLRNLNYNIFDSLAYNSKKYVEYKNLIVYTVNNYPFDQRYDPAYVLNTAIDLITATKDNSQSFFWSDMIPAKAPYASNAYTFNSNLQQTIYPLTQTYNFETANYNGVLVYVARTIRGLTTTKQLVINQEYTVSTTAPSLRITIDLIPGDVVTINEYNQTYGSYIPNTPTKLGLYPAFIPEVVLDNGYQQPTYFIKGHDGSYNKLYGDYIVATDTLIDFRDQALLEFEKRVYNNLKLSNTIPIQAYEVTPGFFRTTDYSYEEWLEIYTPGFLNWVGQNRLNYQQQFYDANNQFTWNYKNTTNKVDNTLISPGYWRGVYSYFYDTTTPESTPWEMLGYVNEPIWWTERYGPAPYTSNNLILWGDLAAGLDWNNGNPVVIPKAVRNGLLKVLPVDSQGKLVSPFVSVVKNYYTPSLDTNWVVGDDGPVEFSYRRSSSWPFDLMRILALTKPAEFFNLGIWVDNYKYNTEFNQYLVDGRSHLIANEIPIYGLGTPVTSYINWVVDYQKQYGINSTTAITNILNNVDVRLVYRLAGFSDQNLLNFYIQSTNPNANNSSLQIPNESYKVLLYSNPPYGILQYSSVIVQLTAQGQYAVFGNSQSAAYFTTYLPKNDGRFSTIKIDQIAVKVADNYTTTEEIVPYGTIFQTPQAVAIFLTSYGAYLQASGATYEYQAGAVPITWSQMVAEFLYWVQIGWQPGAVTTLNPAAYELTIDKQDQIVQPLSVQGANFVLNQNLYPIKNADLAITRDGTHFSVTPLNQGDTISYGQFNLSNFENACVFDNYTLFGDTIYDLITGIRQNRIYVRGAKTAGWNGTYNASGFIINQNNVKQWLPTAKYTKGQIVLYKNQYWIAQDIVQPNATFQQKLWAPSNYKSIQTGLLPNSSTNSLDSTYYYSNDQTALNPDANLLGYSLIGYRQRDYAAIADLTDVTQINVYQNLIKTKGSTNAISAFKGATLPQGGIDYNIYENWAILTSNFGGVLNTSFVQFQLNAAELSGNPFIVGLTDGVYTLGVEQEVPLYALYNYNYNSPPTSPNVLPTISQYVPSTLFPDAGYVNFNDVKMSAYFYSQLASATNQQGIVVPLTNFYVGDYVWLANYLNQWNVYTPISLGSVVQVSNNLNNTCTVTFSQIHGLKQYDLIAIANFNNAVNGYYTVTNVVNNYQITILLTLTSSSRQIVGQGVGMYLSSQRVTTPAQIANLPLDASEFVDNIVWVDTNTDGGWAVYQKTINYNFEEEITQPDNISQSFGAAVAYNSSLGGYLIGDPNNSSVYRYDYNAGTGGYDLFQTLAQGSSDLPFGAPGLGAAIVTKQNIYAITAPYSENPYQGVWLYALNNSILSDNLVPYQQINTGYYSPYSIALSGDTNWLYVGLGEGNPDEVWVYQKQNILVSANNMQSDQTYTIVSVGNTDFTTVGAIENKVGISFLATEIAPGGTGVVAQSNYQQVATIAAPNSYDGSYRFGSSLATDYYGEKLIVGQPDLPYSEDVSNWGAAYVYDRSVQNFVSRQESRTTNNPQPQFFDLIWIPAENPIPGNPGNQPPQFTGTTTVSASNYIGYTATVAPYDLSYYTQGTPVIFSGGNLGSSGLKNNIIYYLNEIAGSYFTVVASFEDIGTSNNVPVNDDSGLSFGIYFQFDPIMVYLNGTVVDNRHYGVIWDQFGEYAQLVYTAVLVAGDIITVSGSNFTLTQTLTTQNTPQVGVQFGTSVDITTYGNEIIVGAPFELTQQLVEGAVYRFTNSGSSYGQVIGTAPVLTSSPRIILINGFAVTIPIEADATLAASTIVSANIINVTASATTDNTLIINLIDVALAPVDEKLSITTVDSFAFDELGIQIYTQTQVVLCPHTEGRTQFGTVVKFNESGSFVASAPAGTRYEDTTFDVVAYPDQDTIFDNNTTQFIDTYPNAGAVYMFDYLGVYNETIYNAGAFVYAQSVNATNLTYGPQPMYGTSLDFVDNKVIVGTPKMYNYDTNATALIPNITYTIVFVGTTDFTLIGASSNTVGTVFTATGPGAGSGVATDGQLQSYGQAVTYSNPVGVQDWEVYRQTSAIVDTSRIGYMQIFSAQTNNTLVNLDYFDPLQNKLLGAVAENIDIISNTDPASYNNGNVTQRGLVWGAEHVGTLWFNTTNVRFINYHQDDVVYNSKYWGAVFPGSDVAIYSWVASNTPPASYQGPGTPYSINLYSVEPVLNASQAAVPTYYFWARNTNIIFTKQNKTLSDNVLTSYINSPVNSGISYMAPVLPNVFSIYNAQQYLNGNDSVFNVGYSTGTTSDEHHTEYALIRENYAEDFLPGLPTLVNPNPSLLYQRLLYSLAGTTIFIGLPPDIVTAPSLVKGQSYQIITIGTTNFTLVGAGPNPKIGEVFVATGPGAGTGTTLFVATTYVVPDPYLPIRVQSGVSPRPQQTFFLDRLTALQNYFEFANNILIKYPIAETREGAPYLYQVGSANPSNNNLPFFNTADYWEFVNWWAPGYDNSIRSSTVVPFYADLITLSVAEGTVVKVQNNGAGVSEWYIFEGGNIWTRIGLQNGTIQFKSSLWNYANAGTGWDGNFYGTTPFDMYPSQETYWLVRALTEQIYTNELLIYRNQSLILLFQYIQSESISSQNYLTWLNKTSLVDVSHNIRALLPYEVYQSDNQDFLAGYLAEALPYHVFIKQFVYVYKGSELWQGNITDFDLPAQYNTTIDQFVSPQLVYSNADGVYTYLPTAPIWQESNYSQWFNNYGLSLVGQSNFLISTLAAYMSLGSSTVIVANASGFPLNGVITIDAEQIAYSTVNRATNTLTNLVRGHNGTEISIHLPGAKIYTDLPAVLLLNGGRGYINPPKITAYIDTSVYPAPTVPAQLAAIMSLDTVVGVNVINPGQGYAVLPEIIIGYSEQIIFASSSVNVLLNTIQLYAPLLLTGDLVKYEMSPGGMTISGLQNNQWYYVNVLQTSPVAVIALYTTYADALNDTNRVVIYNQGSGSNHTLNLGANASAITSSVPVRENIISLKFDRTSYNSRVSDWTSDAFYGSFFAGSLSNAEQMSSSSVILDSVNPNINTILASEHGCLFEIVDVGNKQQVEWSSFIRNVYATVMATNSVNLITDGDLANASGSTVGMTVGMPVQFTGNVGASGLVVGVVYYVAEILSLTDFTISETVNGSVFPLNDQIIATTLTCAVAQVVNTAIITVNYPGIRQITATTASSTNPVNNTKGYLTVPLTEVGTGGTQGFYTGLPVFFVGSVFGGIRENDTYYVTTVLDNQNFTLSTSSNPLTVQVNSTTFGTNIIFAPGILNGVIYQIRSIGTTDFTLIGASSNTIGVVFTANTSLVSGTGTGTVLLGTFYVGVNSTTGLSKNDPVVINNMVIAGTPVTNFGNIDNSTIYYIWSVVDGFNIILSTQFNGDPFPVTTVPSTTDIAATSLIVGVTYTITFVGTTDFTLVGASSNTLGAVFVAIGQTTGTGTASCKSYATLVDQINTIPLTTASGDMTINLSLPVSPGQVDGQLFTFYETSNEYYPITSGVFSNPLTGTIDATVTTLNYVALSSDSSVINFYINMPLQVGTNIGNLTTGTTYYVTDIGTVKITVTNTSSNNQLTCNSTTALYVNMPIIFSGNGLDGIVISQEYFISEIIDTTHFTISESIGGSVFVLTTDNGTMTGTGATYVTVSTSIGGANVALANASGPVTYEQTPIVSSILGISYLIGGYYVNLANPGQGYAVSNIITVSGADVGGSSPLNDVTITVDTVNNYGEIVSAIVSGTIPSVPQNSYYLRVTGTKTFEVYENPLLTVPVSGLDFPYVGFTATTATAIIDIPIGWTTPALMNNPSTVGVANMSVAMNSSGLLVAVGYAYGTAAVYTTSTDDGITWTTVTEMPNTGPSNIFINALTVNSSGLFVAVGYLNNGFGNDYAAFATSTDGSTWTTPALMNGSTATAQMYSVAVNTAGLFVAVGYNDNNYPVYATSADGSTWTTSALMNGSSIYARMFAVTVNSAGLFVAVGYNGNSYPVYATSTDGSTWTTPAVMNGSTTSAIMTSVTVNSAGLFVAVGYDGNNYPVYATSTDGSTWTTPALMNSSTTIANMSSIAVDSSGLFVAVGYDEFDSSIYAISTDGSTWTTPALMDNAYTAYTIMTSIVVNSVGAFIAVGFNGSSYAMSANYHPGLGSGIQVTSVAGFEVNDAVAFTGAVFGNIIAGTIYYILTIDPINNQITVSTTLGGTTPSHTGATLTGSMTMAKVGSYTFLPEPFYFNQSIVKFNHQLYRCIVSNNDKEFIYGKWELLDSGDSAINALDRIVGYYQPTVNMPGLGYYQASALQAGVPSIDFSQLLTGTTYPNSTYIGNPFQPADQLLIDVKLQDEPFYPTDISLNGIVYNGTTYISTANLSTGAATVTNITDNTWFVKNLTSSNSGLTSINYSSGSSSPVYIVTTTNSATPILRSQDARIWSSLGYYTNNNTTTLNLAGLALYDSAYGLIGSVGVYVAVGTSIIKSVDSINWTETYSFSNSTLDNILYGVTYASIPGFTGFVAVGGNQYYSIILTSTDGVNWVSASTALSYNSLYTITTSLTTLVAVGENGIIYYSYDGYTWFGVNETNVISTNGSNNVLTVGNTAGLIVNQEIKFTSSFDVITSGTPYYVQSIVSSTQITLSTTSGGSQLDLVGENPAILTLLYATPHTANLTNVSYLNTSFVALGNNGLMLTSTDGISWTTQASGTTQNLHDAVYHAGTYTVVGDNNTILQSTDLITWTNTAKFTTAPAVYDVQGSAFTSGFGPEELVAGVISDNLSMIVNTLPGTNWDPAQYAHTGYNVVSLQLTPTSSTQTAYSFADAAQVPAQVAVYVIDYATQLCTGIYVNIDYTVDWVTKTVILNIPLPFIPTVDSLRIDVYEVGNGFELVKSNTDLDPIVTNSITGFDQIVVDCQYSGTVYNGNGVVRPGTYPIEASALATESVNDTILVTNIKDFILNGTVTFQGTTFGNIIEGRQYFVKTISQASATITLSQFIDPATGVAGDTLALSDGLGNMTCIIEAGNGTFWSPPITYHNGNKLVVGTTNFVTATVAATNAILCNSTLGLVVNTPITFSNTMFGGVTPLTTYYILTVVDFNNFTISTSPGGSVFPLTDAVGGASFITSDYAIALADNRISATLVFSANYSNTVDYLSYTLFGETEPVQYGYTIPETQLFTGTGSQTVFTLVNYVSEDNPTNAIVEVNGLRQTASQYTIDPIASTVTFTSAPNNGSTVAVTSYNLTDNQYLNTQYGINSNPFTVVNTWQQTNVDRLWVTLNGYRVPSSLLSIGAGNEVTIATTVTSGDEVIVTSMVSTATPNQMSYYLNVNQAQIPTVYNANMARTWLVRPLEHLDSIIYVNDVAKLVDTVVQTVIAPAPINQIISIRLTVDKRTLNSVTVYNNTTNQTLPSNYYYVEIVELAPTLQITAGVTAGNSLTITSLQGNLIYINGEQIGYGSIDFAANSLTQIQRGANGTGGQLVIPAYTPVLGLLPSNRLPEIYYNVTWNPIPGVYNTELGDPLQLADTTPARFLNTGQ